jgi:hypothetical protein
MLSQSIAETAGGILVERVVGNRQKADGAQQIPRLQHFDGEASQGPLRGARQDVK